MIQGVFSVLLYLRLDLGRLHDVNFFLFLFVLTLFSLFLVPDCLSVLISVMICLLSSIRQGYKPLRCVDNDFMVLFLISLMKKNMFRMIIMLNSKAVSEIPFVCLYVCPQYYHGTLLQFRLCSFRPCSPHPAPLALIVRILQ